MEEQAKETVIDINFNNPYQVREIFRYREDKNTGEKFIDEEGELQDKVDSKVMEFSRDAYILWENVREVGGYPYKDDWSIQGEKYFIKFAGSPNEMLILGNMKRTVALWKLFRNLFPMYPTPPGLRIQSVQTIHEKEQEHDEPEGHSTDEDGMV